MKQRLIAAEGKWLEFWFGMADTRALEIVRIGIGFTLLLSYAMQAGHVAEFYSDEGWLPIPLAFDLIEPTSNSLLFRFTDPQSVQLLWAALLASCLALTLGWRTPVTKWLVWIGHLSFTMRAPFVLYGIDDICSNILLILCLAPVGRSFALDARRRAKAGLSRPPSAFNRGRASAALRLIQIQMVICFFFAGAEKLQGEDWWGGDAIWYALCDYEFTFIPLRPLAANPWLINAMTYGALIVELSYGFLIWDVRTRGLALLAAIGVHLGVAAMMGLVLFGIGMVAGHLAFLRPEWIDVGLEKLGRLGVIPGRADVALEPKAEPPRSAP